MKYRFLSLSEPPPPGFTFLSSLSKRDIRSGPFALYADSVRAAELLLGNTGGSLTGIIVTDSDDFVWEPRARRIFHLGVPRSLHGRLSDLLKPFLGLLEEIQSGDDERKNISLELARAVEDRRRLACDFERSRKSLLVEISERRKIEEEQQVLSSLVENSNDLIGIASFDGYLVYLNRAGKRLLGLEDASDLRAVNLRDLIFKKHAVKMEGIFSQLHRAGTWRGEVRFRHFTSGDQIPLETHAFVVRDPKTGQATAFANICQDIRERKSLEREMIKMQKLESLGVLAGGIAHDFNNILSAITGYVSLARLQAPSGGEIGRYLQEAEKATFRAKDLTQQLLTFSRGGAPLKRTVSVGDLVRDSAALVLTGSNVRCEIVLPQELWPVEVDEGQISQVVSNLLINACQAMPDGGVVEISGGNVALGINELPPLPEGKYVRISVKDSGIGITGKHLPKIFDPYFTTKQQGSGLGLATAYAIVKKHEGRITVESALGTGTTFHIHLPASGGEGPARERQEGKPIGGTGKILVMDDQKPVRDVAAAMLTSLGYAAATAEDGAEALKLYDEARKAREPFDAVIMDLTIPGGMGGMETIRKLLELDGEAKAIASSGYSSDGVMADHKTYGFKGVVPKPYNIRQLGEVVAGVLSPKAKGSPRGGDSD
jgi:PAS domain S-box-containing protein